MAEGGVVQVRGVIVYDHPGNAWVEIRFGPGRDGMAIVPRNLLPEPAPVCQKCGTSSCLEDKAMDF
jgi:hypothetical protein